MKLIRSNSIRVIPENSHEKEIIENILKNDCIRDNPKYIKARKKGRFMQGIPKTINTYSYFSKKNEFIFYKANYSTFRKLLDSGMTVNEIKDERISNYTNIVCRTKPRDDQQSLALDNLKIALDDWGYCCLDAAPAAGKTYIACNLMGALKEKTLVIVDMNLLVEQFIDSISFFTNVKLEEIGIIRGQEIDYKDKKIVIATVQTLSKNPEIIKYLNKNIGFVVCDECHVMAASTFQELLPKLKPKYQLGLSGSHERDDGLEFLIAEAIGPIAFRVSRSEMVKSGSMVTPLLRPLFLRDDEKFDKFNTDNAPDFREVVDEYYNCPKAIDKISNLIVHHYKNNDSQLLVCKEKSMVQGYLRAILTKLCGSEIFQKALEEKEENLKILEEKFKIIENGNLKEYANKTDLLKLEKGKMSIKEANIKWKTKKERSLKIVKDEIERCKKLSMEDTEIIKTNKIYNSVKIITGEISNNERNDIIEKTNTGEIKIILSTTTMDKAISINKLNILFLLYSTRERATTMQRVGRISRSAKNKGNAIVYDIIYDHFYSFSQFINKAGDCRMTAHKRVTRIHPSIDDFIEWGECRFRDKYLNKNKMRNFMENWLSKYVIDLNK